MTSELGVRCEGDIFTLVQVHMGGKAGFGLLVLAETISSIGSLLLETCNRQ